MSLVDASYDSDDDDDVADVGANLHLPATTTIPVLSEDAKTVTPITAPSAITFDSASSMNEVQSVQGGGVFSQRASLSPTDTGSPRLRLPDMSELFGPSASDLAKTSDAPKKRPAPNGSAHSIPRSKVPRGNLQPFRVAPDTAGGLLTPPQLRGRSNVATEDLDKIFSRRQRK